jgi:chemotaxis signal transduction protein
MKEDSTLFSVSPDTYAEYLEQLSDTEFWNHAYEKAYMPRSTHAAQALATIAPPSNDVLTCLTCELRTAHCVLPLTLIREILPRTQHITRLPDMPFWMLGILSWRGETIAAIDLCSYLTKSSFSPLQECVFLVVQQEHISLALCVLSVDSIASAVNVQHITPFTLLPITEGGEPPVGIVGVWEHGDAERGQVFVLDMPTLFTDVVQCIERKDSHE